MGGPGSGPRPGQKNRAGTGKGTSRGASRRGPKPIPKSKKAWTKNMAAHRKRLSTEGYKEAFSNKPAVKWNFRTKSPR